MEKIFYTVLYFCSAFLMGSCIDDLNQYPHEEETSPTIYISATDYKAILGKTYAAMVATGQEKGGNNDLSSNSGQDYIRCFFNLRKYRTDEMASTWLSDDNVTGLTYLNRNTNNPWISDACYHVYYNIVLCSELFRNATDEKVVQFMDQKQTKIRVYRAEVRFMRALSYYCTLDLLRSIPFMTEDDPPIGYLPPRYTVQQILNYIKSELNAIKGEVLNEANCPYGRASRRAVYTLFARLYLNVETCT